MSILIVLWAVPAPGAAPIPTGLAAQAIAICKEADAVPTSERAALLAIGLTRAESAVQTDPGDATAHFAVFCNLGKRLKTLSAWRLLGNLGELSRARKELDAALALAPDYPAALAAKGQMLAELPRLAGGDQEEAERLLRRAVVLDPENPRLRLLLAAQLKTVGQREAARAQALIAVDILERVGPADQLAAARSVAAGLQ